MLKISLLHPEILSVLGRNGHGAKVLIADGNFPFTTCVPATASKVYLNLAPGMLKVTDVLSVLKEVIPIEKFEIMLPPDGVEQSIHSEFKDMLDTVECFKLKRFEFYDQAKSAETCLVIATGETRRFANILLTIGVVK